MECVIDGRILSAPATHGDPAATHGDPAAALAASYVRDGDAAVTALRGDFVVLLWDHARGRGLLARDQLGGRSLHYHTRGQSLVFGSEARDVLQRLPACPGPDRAAVVHWLANRDVREGRTVHEGVRALLPGHLLAIADGRVTVRRWWEPRYGGCIDATRREAAAEVRERLEAAVRRATAGGHAAVLMSGGLDSAGVAAIAARAGGATAYSGVFPETPTVDESDFISAISEAVGIAVVREPVPVQSMLDGAVAFPAEWRLPLRPQNMYAWQPLLRRAADDGATAVLDGEGGDLLFMARRELIADSLRALRPARAVRLARALPGNRPRGGTRLVLREWGLRMALPAAWHESTYAQRRNLAALPPWLQGRDPQALAVDASWEWKRFDGPRWWARLADALCGGLQAVGIRDHLRRRAAMSGLEAISPFFDVDLVELVLRLPPELAFDQALTRPVQRDAMEGLLPDAVRLRAGKSYFDELFQRSFGVRDLDAVRSLLAAPDAEIGAFVDLRAVREDIVDQHPARHPRGVRYWMNSAWRLSTMECWLRQEADGKFAARRLAGREDSSSVVQSGASA